MNVARNLASLFSSATSAAVQAEEDRQRLVNIENMLKQLTGQE